MGQGGAVKEVWGVAGGAVAFGAAVADEGSLQKQRAGLMVIGKGIAVLLPVVPDLVRDGGGVFLDELGNGLEGHALSEAVLNHLALLQSKMFVFSWVRFFSHMCGLLSEK